MKASSADIYPLAQPGSVLEEVTRELLVALFVGPSASLWQVVHPVVCDGISRFSQFGKDPFGRFRRVALANWTISFGDRQAVLQVKKRVGNSHVAVRQQVDGVADGMLWVHATRVILALRAFELIVRPLSTLEREAYYAQSQPVGHCFGVRSNQPDSYADLMQYIDSCSRNQLLVDERTLAIARIVLGTCYYGLPLGQIARITTAGLVPELRNLYGLKWGRFERIMFFSIVRCLKALRCCMPRQLRYWPQYRVQANSNE
jgi:uncharacterized protein (DUF2236 family)